MEQPSVTYSDAQSIDYFGQSHNWTDTDIISSYKKICKQLDICQEKLKIQKGQRKFKKSYSHSKQLSQKAVQQAQQSQRERNVNVVTIGHIGNTSKKLKQQKKEPVLFTEERHLIRMKNALWRRMGPSVGCIGKGNKLVSPKTLKCSSQYQRNDIYSDQQEKCHINVIQTHSSSSYVTRYDRSLKNRRIQRKIRYASKIDTNYFMQLPRQNISNNPFANQIFNGINFY
ncbi:hypothetical protein C1646_808827 [Rhizophagus diaphanus]|nr:hypothetical protein C1646_808827 [Rhizophagus diaphanus] [Rhizophagus sp. MUCL 43196]